MPRQMTRLRHASTPSSWPYVTENSRDLRRPPPFAPPWAVDRATSNYYTCEVSWRSRWCPSTSGRRTRTTGFQVCSTLTRRRVNAELDRSIGLTATQIGALFYIRGSDGCTLKDLASALHVNGSAITTLVSRLEQRELVMRERSAQDGRAFQLSLTPAGHTAVEHAEPQLGELNAWIPGGVHARRARHRSPFPKDHRRAALRRT